MRQSGQSVRGAREVQDEPWLSDLIKEGLCGTVELGRSDPFVLVARDQRQVEEGVGEGVAVSGASRASFGLGERAHKGEF